jgi:hypothetical protein
MSVEIRSQVGSRYLIQYCREFGEPQIQRDHRWVSREEFETIPSRMRRVEIDVDNNNHDDGDD